MFLCFNINHRTNKKPPNVIFLHSSLTDLPFSLHSEGPSDRGRIPTARFNSRQKISHPFFSKTNPQGQTSATFCNKKSLLFPFTFHQNLERLSMYVEFPRLFIQKRKALSSLEIWVSSGKVSRKDICFAWVDSPFLHANKSYVLHQ